MFIRLGQRLERSNTNGGDWGQRLKTSDISGRDIKATSRRTCTEADQRFIMFDINGIDCIKKYYDNIKKGVSTYEALTAISAAG